MISLKKHIILTNKKNEGNCVRVPNLFIITNLACFIIFSALPFETRANQEANLKSQRYYSDGILLSRAEHWKEAADEFKKAIQVDPEHKLA